MELAELDKLISVLITVNVTKVTCRGCYHFRWSESLHTQPKQVLALCE